MTRNAAIKTWPATLALALALGLILVATQPAAAQDSTPPSLQDPYHAAAIPLSGAYFDPNNPSLSLLVDIRPDGSAFVLLGTYNAAGTPTWYFVQDWFEPSSAYPEIPQPEFHQAESLGDITGPVYLADGGACIKCPPKLPHISPTDLDGQPGTESATMTWRSSSHVDVALGNEQWSMIRLPLDGSLADRFMGPWQLSGWVSDNRTAVDSRIYIAPVSSPMIEIDIEARETSAPLPDNATHWFIVACKTNCGTGADDYSFWQGDSRSGRDRATTKIETYLWFDEHSGKAGLEQFITPIPAVSSGCSFCPAPPKPPVLASPFRYRFDVNFTADGLTARRAQQASFFDVAGPYPMPVTGSVLGFQRLDAPNF